MKQTKTTIKQKTARNDAVLDKWSAVHFVTSAVLCVLFGPVIAVVVTYIWEPIEIFVISPIVARFGILFGHETLRNSLSDIAVNTIGVGAGLILLQIL